MASIEIGQPLTARGKATRARIVEAATELVRAHGVANTSLDAVLAASDTSKSQLYHYFADKDDLVLAVIQRQTECVLATHESHLRKLHSLSGLRRWRDAVVELSRQTDCANWPSHRALANCWLKASHGGKRFWWRGSGQYKRDRGRGGTAT